MGRKRREKENKEEGMGKKTEIEGKRIRKERGKEKKGEMGRKS